jgi:hypothetical protein
MHAWVSFVLILTLAGSLVWLGSRAMRSARRGMPGVSGFGWALLFLGSGRMPPPPPASQIEQEMQTRKDRLNSRQDEDL